MDDLIIAGGLIAMMVLVLIDGLRMINNPPDPFLNPNSPESQKYLKEKGFLPYSEEYYKHLWAKGYITEHQMEVAISAIK